MSKLSHKANDNATADDARAMTIPPHFLPKTAELKTDIDE